MISDTRAALITYVDHISNNHLQS